MKKSSHLIISALLVCAVTGCAGTRAYMHPEADFAAIKRVFVLPFGNLTNDRYAGERVTNVFMTSVLVMEEFEVIEPGEVARAMKDLKMTDRELDSADVKKLGESLTAQAAFTGAVEQYSLERIKQETYPVVAITVRLVDIETGNIIWMTSQSETGASKTPIVSLGEVPTLSRLTEILCERIVNSLGGR